MHWMHNICSSPRKNDTLLIVFSWHCNTKNKQSQSDIWNLVNPQRTPTEISCSVVRLSNSRIVIFPTIPTLTLSCRRYLALFFCDARQNLSYSPAWRKLSLNFSNVTIFGSQQKVHSFAISLFALYLMCSDCNLTERRIALCHRRAPTTTTTTGALNFLSTIGFFFIRYRSTADPFPSCRQRASSIAGRQNRFYLWLLKQKSWSTPRSQFSLHPMTRKRKSLEKIPFIAPMTARKVGSISFSFRVCCAFFSRPWNAPTDNF